IRLLTDLKTIFDSSTLTAIPTATILSRLVDLPESPWGDLKGRQINDRILARRLRQYGVKSKKLRVGDTTAMGYAREDLVDVWLRYLPLSPEKRNKQNKRNKARKTGTSRVPATRMCRIASGTGPLSGTEKPQMIQRMFRMFRTFRSCGRMGERLLVTISRSPPCSF